MEIESIKEKITAFIKKYKYAALILLIGLTLMLLPTTGKDISPVATEVQTENNEESTEAQLEKILSKIDGAGDVLVMLTEERGERVIYQTDSNISTSADSSNQSVNTVTVTDAQKNQGGLVIQIEPPIYLGAVVVSQGANKPAVKLALVEAVSKVTGLGANQITVLKMK